MGIKEQNGHRLSEDSNILRGQYVWISRLVPVLGQCLASPGVSPAATAITVIKIHTNGLPSS
ncbi:hypothetical protein jhhlp_008174 [Lomentospora prolificans]|uniref:Uncharacterized protein n=1 Tax=Lomentospora prolificans TaxID=41688 RepID=A0A2N3MZS2_9PEZI|nr:hypothetical protein jhhlp_008174 [Lomentospora prolificans]